MDAKNYAKAHILKHTRVSSCKCHSTPPVVSSLRTVWEDRPKRWVQTTESEREKEERERGRRGCSKQIIPSAIFSCKHLSEINRWTHVFRFHKVWCYDTCWRGCIFFAIFGEFTVLGDDCWKSGCYTFDLYVNKGLTEGLVVDKGSGEAAGKVGYWPWTLRSPVGSQYAVSRSSGWRGARNGLV